MTLFSAPIAASADDTSESAGTMDLTGGVVNVNNTGMYGGFRFPGVTIPPGSTINSVTLDLNFTSTSFDSPDVLIYLEDVDDAAAFAASANNINSRTLTTAVTPWNAANVGAGVRTTPNFAGALQEVIDRPGWGSGKAVAVIIKGNSAASVMRVSTWDSANPEAVLNVDYTAPAGGSGQPARTLHQFRQRVL